MIKRKSQFEAKKRAGQAGNAFVPDEKHAVVQSQQEAQTDGGEARWQEWGESWQRGAAEALSQQREAIEWWARLSECWAQPACRARKVQTLGQRLGCTLTASMEAVAALSVDQQRQVAGLAREAQHILGSGSPAAVQAFVHALWANAASAARSWGMIPATSQAQIAGAWAEFWSLPGSEPSAE